MLDRGWVVTAETAALQNSPPHSQWVHHITTFIPQLCQAVWSCPQPTNKNQANSICPQEKMAHPWTAGIWEHLDICGQRNPQSPFDFEYEENVEYFSFLSASNIKFPVFNSILVQWGGGCTLLMSKCCDVNRSLSLLIIFPHLLHLLPYQVFSLRFTIWLGGTQLALIRSENLNLWKS